MTPHASRSTASRRGAPGVDNVSANRSYTCAVSPEAVWTGWEGVQGGVGGVAKGGRRSTGSWSRANSRGRARTSVHAEGTADNPGSCGVVARRPLARAASGDHQRLQDCRCVCLCVCVVVCVCLCVSVCVFPRPWQTCACEDRGEAKREGARATAEGATGMTEALWGAVVAALLLWLTAACMRGCVRARCGPTAPVLLLRTRGHGVTHLTHIRVVLVRCRGPGRAGMTHSGVTRTAQGVVRGPRRGHVALRTHE